jgi:hypothetical protein
LFKGKYLTHKNSLSIGLITCFFMQQELQQASHNTYYGFLQAPMLSTPLLLQKLHAKIATMAIQISLLPMRVDSHSPRLIVLIPHALITMGCDFSHQPLLHVFNDWALIHSKGN